MLLNIVTLAVFVATFATVFLVLQAFFAGRRHRTVERWEEMKAAKNGNGGKNNGGQSKELFGPWTESLAAQIPQAQIEVEGLEQDLKRAGYYRPTARREYLAMRNTLSIIPLIATGIAAVLCNPTDWSTTLTIVIAGLFTSILGFSLPRLYVRWQATRRVQRILNGLPDALDMITMAVSGGASFQGALEHVSREISVPHPDLALELKILRQQAELGTLEQALSQFARRIAAPEVKSLTALLTQSQRLGTDVGRALQDYADNARRNQRQRAEERANRTTVKMLFPLVFCLAPSVFILLLGPALLEIREFFFRETRPGGVLSQEYLNNSPAVPTGQSNQQGYRFSIDLPTLNDQGRP